MLMMKHAVLIMAHKNKEQLIRLIQALACDSFDFYVHLDIKWNLSREDILDIKTCAENVYVIEKRIHGELDQWSLPQITLNLIDDALAHEKAIGEEYSYFLLLSGQDYPIKSNSYILNYLSLKYPAPIMDTIPYDPNTWIRNKFDINKYINAIDRIHEKMQPGLTRKITVLPYVIGEKIEKNFLRAPKECLEEHGLKLYGGSAWWILPKDIIAQIESLTKHKKIINAFKRSTTPEETFFQTAYMNSQYKDRACDSECYLKNEQKCATYANFCVNGKPITGHPYILTKDDYDRIISKPQLFARKFDITVDKEILNMIDNHRLRNNE